MYLEISSLENIHGRLTARFAGAMGLPQLLARTAKGVSARYWNEEIPLRRGRTFLTSVDIAFRELPPWRIVGSRKGAFEEEDGVGRCYSNTLDTASLILSCDLRTSSINPKS